MRSTAVILFTALFTVVGCNQRPAVILGQPPNGQIRTVASIRTATPTDPVTLTGSMIEKCPVAGCWFRLRDQTGVIKVDTRAAGFVVADVPVKSTLVVSGKVVADGDSFSIEATGVRY